MNESTPLARRPLKVRQASFAKQVAIWLSNKKITPNQISIASIVFAGLASICLLMIPHLGVNAWLIPVAAAVFIQCRLLCNLFDGMVAVEGAKGTRAGELFNDIPDRIADPMILIALGYSVINYDWAINLGWAAGLLAVMTAYVRTLSASIDAPIDFQGPMAKQHRMAVVTIACVLAAIEGVFFSSQYALVVALTVIIAGCVITVFNRARAAYQFLEANNSEHE